MKAGDLVNEGQEKSLIATSVTPKDIEENIVAEHYFVASDAIQQSNAVHVCSESGWHLGSTQCLTFCLLVLKNGFTVTGESACASIENFNAEKGRNLARKNAVDKIWMLMGYELRTKLSNQSDVNQ